MRYAVHGPTNNTRHIGSALTPPMARAASTISRGMVCGYPGTMRVPAPSPAAVTQHPAFLVNSGVSRSSNAPNLILPAVYFEAGSGYGNHEHAPVSRMSDNQMPVPAVRAPNVIVSDPYRARKGGQLQVVQPQVVQVWKGLYGRG